MNVINSVSISPYHVVLEVILGFGSILVCMLIHSIGMFQVMHRFENNWPNFSHDKKEFYRQVYFFYLVILILMTHLIEIMFLGSMTHYLIGAFDGFRTAFYFAGETYTALGTGEVLLPKEWRLVSMFITMSGLLTFGWTTGVLVNILGKTYDAQFAFVRKKNAGKSSAVVHSDED